MTVAATGIGYLPEFRPTQRPACRHCGEIEVLTSLSVEPIMVLPKEISARLRHHGGVLPHATSRIPQGGGIHEQQKST